MNKKVKNSKYKTLISSKSNEEFNNIYLKLWDDQGYLPDPVSDAFRTALVKTAIEICHETGDKNSTVDFCVDIILEWLKIDKPKITVDKH